ncbi:SET and MYND domain-containing protein DDB_G0273589-like [Sitodiplosis mosellana]|uniref:SET and MYND domain-containing protein DDB_G0273589-like n=1 Tax=Sitodiplosis mosellana TaxID=263140 RepID=UPI002444AC36|nr:SET and MYND domain-containing protein DDB_G0273589-like [Sitodiplosis mosellana]
MVQRDPGYQPKLDYAANEHFPCLADVVKIQCDEEFGRHLVAKSDIPYGKVVLLEEKFAVTDVGDFSMCYTCFRENSNFIACKGCTEVVFCSLECMNRNQTHGWECGKFIGRVYLPNNVKVQCGTNRMRLVAQTLLTAISTFADIVTLMQFVEKMLREDPDQLPSSLHDQVSKYHFFFKLKKRMVDPLDDVKRVFLYTMTLPKIRAMFDSEEKQRFFMHLVAHHSFVVDTNSFGNDLKSSVENVGSLLNHSCDPNITTCDFGKIKSHMTCRPIKKGEQLLTTYIDMNLSKELRQEKLRKIWGFECKCKKCVSTDDSDEINTPPTLDPTT